MNPSMHGAALAVLLTVLCWTSLAWSAPPIIQPGAPGQPSRQIEAKAAVELAGLRHAAADVRFMSDMIPHHQQALEMSALAPARSQSRELLDLARRSETTQLDEIEFMEQWLIERGEGVPDRDWLPHVAWPTCWRCWPRTTTEE